MLRKPLSLLLAVSLLCFAAGMGAGAAGLGKEISVIYVYYNGFGQIYLEYKVDLQNKAFWKYNAGFMDTYVPRDPSAENEGFEFVRMLEEKKISAFRRKAALCGFTKWRERYQRGIIVEDYWYVMLVYSDGTTKRSYGNGAALPLAWNCMYQAFEALTGETVLRYQRGWWR